ncbi:hypothetical protein K2173_017333 [Erythroxylum novogranatense]|uniref:Uncharacterized protein n=1 Tax=Erythroxylum novogranatense TaxID=1862640 RepID=A0AAV8TMC4_9ROSI|nr:hypothetical protein K2173_017333 [Erythroxylum novogranatense]
MKEHQTSHEEHSRSSDLSKCRSKHSLLKKPQKVLKKSLNGEFTKVAQDVSPDPINDSSDLLELNHSVQTAESFVFELNPAFSPSSETFPLTPTSNMAIMTEDTGDYSPERHLPEVDVVMIILKQVRTELLKSPDADHRYKKLLDGLLEIVVEEYLALPQEKELFSVKCRVVCLIFLLWVLLVWMVLRFAMESQSSYAGPLAT